MLVAGFPAGAFAANCYIVAPEAGAECVIVDPGQDAESGIDEILAEHRLRPAAVLLTHGHLDHIWSVAPVCGAKGIPAYIHPDDRVLLTDPAATNKKMKLIWICAGDKDFALGGAQNLDKLLTEHNIKHSFSITPGVHEWKVWRYSLNQFAPLLFQ